MRSAKSKRLEEAKERRAQARAEVLERLLPWEVENKLAALFTLVKVPLIVFVGVFGYLGENQVKELTVARWSRGVLAASGPSCFVHKLDASRMPEHTEYSLIQWMNQTFMGGRLGAKKKVKLVDATLEVAGRDLCGFDERCRPTDVLSKSTRSSGGVQHAGSFALIWMFFKLAFIGIHPIDRIARKTCDRPPVLKLLTEPHFQICEIPMAMLVKVLFLFRYRIMPNALLTAILTVETHPVCPEIIYYKMDWFWGTVTLYAIWADLLITISCYVAAWVKNTSLVGTWKYRTYKTMWFFSSIFPGIFVMFDVLTTVQWNVFKLFRLTFRVVLTFDVTFAFYIDFLQVFIFLISVLEVVEFTTFVMQLLCPKVLARCGLMEKLEFLDRFGDWGAPDQEEIPDSDSDDESMSLTITSETGPPSAKSKGGGKKGVDLGKKFKAFTQAQSSFRQALTKPLNSVLQGQRSGPFGAASTPMTLGPSP